ncbi:hypothetical protein T484DRAFT_1765722, partial [Baffinella frigidus]
RYVIRYFWGADAQQEIKCSEPFEEIKCSGPFEVGAPEWCSQTHLQVEGDAVGLHLDQCEAGESLSIRWQAPRNREGAGDVVVLVECGALSDGPPAIGGPGAMWFLAAPAAGGAFASTPGAVTTDLANRPTLPPPRQGAGEKGDLMGGEFEPDAPNKPGWFEAQYTYEAVDAGVFEARYTYEAVHAGVRVRVCAARSRPFQVLAPED